MRHSYLRAYPLQASSSNGRASDSKSEGWGFESLLACHFLPVMRAMKKQAEEADRQGFVRKFEDLRIFFEQSKVEMKKVVWPGRQETMSTSSAVLVLVVVLAFFLGTVDFGLSKIIAAILS